LIGDFGQLIGGIGPIPGRDRQPLDPQIDLAHRETGGFEVEIELDRREVPHDLAQQPIIPGRDLRKTIVGDREGARLGWGQVSSFWVVLDNRGWCHPYDADGRRRDFDDIPSAVSDLVDDPYRSLAGELRQAGGFAKDVTPFSEFIWADFLRHRIKPKEVKAKFSSALAMALKLARSQDADYLPG
jgi:hypothetical protein